MKKLWLSLVLLSLGLTAQAAETVAWTEDWDGALKQAKQENKDLLVDFTGSDWCIWCQKLEAEVFSQKAFQTEAPKNYILVRLDYPQNKPQKAEIRARNARLAEQYAIEGYPTILLLDANGKVFGKSGYQEGGAVEYLQTLKDLQTKKAQAYALKDKADKATGTERAGWLDQFFQALTANGTADHWQEIPAEILKLDEKNQGKEGSLYNRYRLLQEFNELKASWNDGTNFSKELPRIDALITKATPSRDLLKTNPAEVKLLAAQAQDIMIIKAAIQYRILSDGKKATETLKAAIQVAPESGRTAEIQGMINSIE